MAKIRDNQPNQKAMQVSATSSKPTSGEGFAKAWAKLCAAYPRMELSQATTEVYYERLGRYDYGKIMGAVDLAIGRSKFFPTVAELLENIANGRSQSLRIDEPRPSQEEASRVLESLRKLLAKETVEMDARELDKAEARKKLLSEQAKQLGVKEK